MLFKVKLHTEVATQCKATSKLVAGVLPVATQSKATSKLAAVVLLVLCFLVCLLLQLGHYD